MKKVLDGKKAYEAYFKDLEAKYNKLEVKPCIAIIHDNNPASMSYLKGRKKIIASLNATLKEFIIDENMTSNELENLVISLNNDVSIDGIMIDRPLPNRFDEVKILSLIDGNKDIDGYTFKNLGKILNNQDCFYPCTPAAAIKLAEFYNISLASKIVLVIGRSINVGKPLALMLLNKNATVTIAHSKTTNLDKLTKKADIIFVCVGKANFIKKEQITRKTILIDIGINFDSNNKLCGDVDRDCYEYARAYSPVPGGVGVMTNLLLMENLLKAYQLKHHD